MGLFTRFNRCNRGAAAIEFAIIATVLFTFLIGFIEMSLIFFTSNVLEGATSVASRIGKTGYSADFVPRKRYIRNEIMRLSGGYLDRGLIDIKILSYGSFEKIGQPEPCTKPKDPPPCNQGYIDVNGNGQWDADQGKEGPGEGRAVVLYKVTYPWALFTPLISQLVGDGSGNYDITAISTVKNENF